MDNKFSKLEHYNNLAIANLDQKNYLQAVSAAKKALKLSRNAVSYFLLGLSYQNLGKSDQALPYYKEAIIINPKFTLAYINIAAIYLETDYPQKAYPYLAEAFLQDPANAFIYTNFGNFYKMTGQDKKAIEYYQKSLRLSPGIRQNYVNLAGIYFSQNKLKEAGDLLAKAILIDSPENAETCLLLGSLSQKLGDNDKSEKYYQQAIKINPGFAPAYNDLGNFYKLVGNNIKAIESYQKAIKYDSNFSEAYHNLGVTLKEQGRFDQAIKLLQKSLKLNPNSSETLAMLGFIYRVVGDLKNAAQVFSKLDSFTKAEITRGEKIREIPSVNVVRCDDVKLNFQVARDWSYFIQESVKDIHQPFVFKKTSKRKIRIGYLSCDFQNHATAHLMLGVFKKHNKAKFEIYAYSYGKDNDSFYRQKIAGCCDVFQDVEKASYIETAELIFKDKIDILVDLKGHTLGSRLEIAALRPAPIQVTYLGFPGTTGASFFDYLITDEIVTPKSHVEYYQEKCVFLPDCYQANDNEQEIAGEELNRNMFGLPAELSSVVFCSFNQSYKIDSATITSWINILKNVKNSVLWLYETNVLATKNLKSYVKLHGINPQRLIFAKDFLKSKHLKRLQLADLALDTFIYNGHTTTSDSLWAGVPVITLQGNHFASRVSSSILKAIDLPELITHSAEEYEDLAIKLAKSPKLLKLLKDKLQKNRLTKPLFDTKRFTRNLEEAYLEMWRIYQSGQKPRMITIHDK